jgi:hypothetical protein
VCSPAFTKQYGNIKWQQYYSPENFSPDAPSGRLWQTGKALSPRIVRLNVLGTGHEENFVAEAYNFSNQVFLLLYPESELSSRNMLA